MFTTNVAITGISEAGKTTFLTSLLWHINEYGSGTRFTVKDKKSDAITINSVKINPDKLHSQDVFNWQRAVSELSNTNKWLPKTTDAKKCTIRFNRSDWSVSSQQLNFFDFAGERIADAGMYGCKNILIWSDETFNRLCHHHSDLIRDYTNELSGCNDDHFEYIFAYRKLLYKLACRSAAYITPSTFLLDENGQTIWKKSNENFNDKKIQNHPQITDYCFAGISGDEFALLPPDIVADEKRQHIVQRFESAYQNYRRKIVIPLVNKLFSIDKLLVLVNIPQLLQHGDKRFNDNTEIVGNLLDTLNPDGGFLRKILGINLVKPYISTYRNLRDVIFVAAQADRVLGKDRDNLSGLLRKMLGVFQSKYPKFKYHFEICSAVKSTREFPNFPDKLIDKEGTKFDVSCVPEEWGTYVANDGGISGRWEPRFAPNYYRFPKPMPDIPGVRNTPPEHIHLDDIFNLLIN